MGKNLHNKAFKNTSDKKWFGQRLNLKNGNIIDTDIYIEDIAFENDELFDSEDYRLVFDIVGKYVATMWYLPTRVEDIVIITGFEIDEC